MGQSTLSVALENTSMSSVAEVNRRIDKLEESQEAFEDTLARLVTTVALFEQTVQSMAKREEKRDQFYERTLLFAIGGLISAVIAWVVRGGLGL